LTSREDINMKMRVALDEVTEGWGVRVTRVELKDIIPPHEVQQAMEKQMQAEREKRAAVLRAEGQRQAAILTAEGEKQSAILTAEGNRQSLILNAEGDAQALVTVQRAQAEAIQVVFEALATSHPTPEILKYLYIQALPKMAEEPPTSCLWFPPNWAASPPWAPPSQQRAQTPPPTRPHAIECSDRLQRNAVTRRGAIDPVDGSPGPSPSSMCRCWDDTTCFYDGSDTQHWLIEPQGGSVSGGPGRASGVFR
jgi:hypothetical protein